VASSGDNSSFSEGVIIEYSEIEIPLNTLIHIHLLTHKSTSNHSRRNLYRSAVYTYSENQQKQVYLIKSLELHEKKLRITTRRIQKNPFVKNIFTLN